MRFKPSSILGHIQFQSSHRNSIGPCWSRCYRSIPFGMSFAAPNWVAGRAAVTSTMTRGTSSTRASLRRTFFLDGIGRLERGLRKRRVALLCSEENPEHCHRRLLIGRVLAGRGVRMTHVRGDGRLEVEPPHDFGRHDGGPQQLTLFGIDEDSEWRSTRSVLPRSPRESSSAH
jgi:hypothetical protein